MPTCVTRQQYEPYETEAGRRASAEAPPEDATIALAMPPRRVVIVLYTFLVSAFAVGIPPMDYLKATETFATAKLSATEREEILQQVKSTGGGDSDGPLEDELRVRRVSLGSVDGLVIRGSHFFCSPTGNCMTWVFCKRGDHWVSLFLGDAPIAQRFGFERKAIHGVRNLVLSEHGSATETSYTIWGYNGKSYEPIRCYGVIYPVSGDGPLQTKVTPCN